MKILLDNVNISSSSGPNSFGRLLSEELKRVGHHISLQLIDPDVQLSFIVASQKKAKLALRLDGIYFNSRQDWESMNLSIKNSFNLADVVIFRSMVVCIILETSQKTKGKYRLFFRKSAR